MTIKELLYTACRVNEAVTLHMTDVFNCRGKVRSEITIRKGNTKGKLATRAIPVLEDLQAKLGYGNDSVIKGSYRP